MPFKHSVVGGTPNKRSLIVTSPATLPLTIPPSPSFQTDPFPPVAARSSESSWLGEYSYNSEGVFLTRTGQGRDAQVIRLEQAGGYGRVILGRLLALRADGISPLRSTKGWWEEGKQEW